MESLITPLKSLKQQRNVHPCFDADAKKKHGRIHLPVAPNCNVQCNYCNRKFDCVNESRPGVCSSILYPAQALEYIKQILNKGIDISVLGIAGPGDPLANAKEVFETIALCKENFPELLTCISTNGIEVPNYINDIINHGISHITLTINAIEPEILSEIYSWARFNKKIYRGIDAGKLIHEKQMEALYLLKKANITVKVNTIVLPGYNDKHIEEVAEKAAQFGADVMNCIPVYPNKETAFEFINEPTKQQMHDLREITSKHIKPMAHCMRCRADAAGLLGQDIADSKLILTNLSNNLQHVTTDRPYVAVASREGMLVNQHLGEASDFYIFGLDSEKIKLVGKRKAPLPGSGDFRWIQLAKTLSDCNTILVSGAGANPTSMLKSMKINVVQMNGLIESGLDAVFKGKSLKGYQKTTFKCGDSCEGNSQGCL